MTTAGDGGQERTLDELDIEAFAREHPADPKPRARTYVIRIDREIKRVDRPELSGAGILALVNKSAETHKLFQKFRGGQTHVVEPNEVVSFTKPGVERFQTIPNDTTEGS